MHWIKTLVQKTISNLNVADIIVSAVAAFICTIYKYFAEDWYSLGFILLFVCLKYILFIMKSIVCKDNIDEIHLIKLMFLALIFVFFQMVLCYLTVPKLFFRVALVGTVILINSGLRIIVLHKLRFTA